MSDIKRKPGRPKSTNPPKAGVSFRLSADAVAMLVIMAEKDGRSQTSIVERALLKYAESLGIPWQKTP